MCRCALRLLLSYGGVHGGAARGITRGLAHRSGSMWCLLRFKPAPARSPRNFWTCSRLGDHDHHFQQHHGRAGREDVRSGRRICRACQAREASQPSLENDGPAKYPHEASLSQLDDLSIDNRIMDRRRHVRSPPEEAHTTEMGKGCRAHCTGTVGHTPIATEAHSIDLCAADGRHCRCSRSL